MCRNPLIASLLQRRDYIEKLGSGIGRFRSALKRANCPEVKPSFTGFFNLEFPRPTYYETSEKTSEKIFRLAAENRQITISEMAKTVGVTTRSIERNIENLKAQGKLQRVGPDKGAYWQVVE